MPASRASTRLPFPGFNSAGSLLLPLAATSVTSPAGPMLEVHGVYLQRKSEFHVTLLNRRLGARLLRSQGEDLVRSSFESFEWTPQRTGEYWLLHRDKPGPGGVLAAWSLIELLELPALRLFVERLGLRAGIEIAPPVPHLTHYVAGDPDGIGVADAEAFRAYAVERVELDAGAFPAPAVVRLP